MAIRVVLWDIYTAAIRLRKTDAVKAMRYYLNVVTDNGLIKDPDGEEFPHIYAAMAEAEQSARAVMVGELEAGRKLLPAWGVQIANSGGVVIDEVSFGEVLQGSGSSDRVAARAPAVIKEACARVQESQKLGREVRESLAKTRAELRTLFRLSTELAKLMT